MRRVETIITSIGETYVKRSAVFVGGEEAEEDGRGRRSRDEMRDEMRNENACSGCSASGEGTRGVCVCVRERG